MHHWLRITVSPALFIVGCMLTYLAIPTRIEQTIGLPLNKASKVQQRGVPATRAIIEKLLAGVHAPADSSVLIVDVIPNKLLV